MVASLRRLWDRLRARRVDRRWAPVTSGAKDCCRDWRNLRVIERQPHVQVRRCMVCGCRHFRAFMGQGLPPGKIGIS